MPTLKQRIDKLEAYEARINSYRRPDLTQLIREARPDPGEVATLSYDELLHMARARHRGEPITALSKPDSNELLHVLAMRFPTPDGWRNATSDELAEYEAALLAVQAKY
jgi:hypothetical protein